MKLDLNEYSTFGNLLQKLCQSKGVTIREASKGLSMSPAYICDIQKGNRRPPKDELLHEIFAYFNIDEIQQEELLHLIHLEKQEIDNETAEFLTKNKQAAKLIKQMLRIKNFDAIIKENPQLYNNLQFAIDEITLANIEESKTITK